MDYSVLSGVLLWLLLLAVSPSSQGEPIPDPARSPSGSGPSGETLSTAQDVSTQAQGPEEDKRGWRDLQVGWGKRGWQDLQSGWGKRGWQDLQGGWGKRGWQDLQGGWGKRGWQDLQGGWGKRAWDKFHGSWGKRDSDLDFDVSSLDDDTMAEEDDSDDKKRAWTSLRGGWGKRAADWANFRGSWGKRDPGWNNLKGLWGKRADNKWNRLSAAWGKRSIGGEAAIKEDPERAVSSNEE